MPSTLRRAAARAAPVLAGGQADGVVVHPDRGRRAEPLRQPFAEREPAPGGDVERGHQPGGPLHRAAAAAADAGELGRAATARRRAPGCISASRVRHRLLGVQVAPASGSAPRYSSRPPGSATPAAILVPPMSTASAGRSASDHRSPPPEMRTTSACDIVSNACTHTSEDSHPCQPPSAAAGQQSSRSANSAPAATSFGSVKEEMRQNLLARLRAGEDPFPGHHRLRRDGAARTWSGP